MTTITVPEGFADWPKPAQRFAMRVLTETTWDIERWSYHDHETGTKTISLDFWDPDMYTVCDAVVTVSFIQRPGQGWRFWYGDNAEGYLLRSMREILYRFGSSVERERSAR